MLKLAIETKVGYRLLNISALDVRKIGPFKVKRRIGKVAFELNLPLYIKIYLVISYVYLEPITPNLKRR